MKSVCIVLKKNKNAFHDGKYLSVMQPFCLNGYAFEEVRILPIDDCARLKEVLLEIKGGYDNVFVLVDTALQPFAKQLFSEVFPEGIYQQGKKGAGIFQSPKQTWFLLVTDDREAGEEYAKEICVPYLQSRYNVHYEKYVIRAIGANEALSRRLVEEAERLGGEQVFCRYTREFGEDRIEIFYDDRITKRTLDEIVRLFAENLNDSIYALEDISIEEQLVRLLKLRGKKVSVTESFTGGGVGARIVSVSGASAVYFEGINAYDELSKRKRLGVSEYTLKTQGAVSDQTAYEMAAGLIATGDCDISIATTGLAGPKSDRSLLPVGLCYIGIGLKERVFVYRYKFEGTRDEITQTGIKYALFLTYKQLKNM